MFLLSFDISLYALVRNKKSSTLTFWRFNQLQIVAKHNTHSLRHSISINIQIQRARQCFHFSHWAGHETNAQSPVVQYLAQIVVSSFTFNVPSCVAHNSTTWWTSIAYTQNENRKKFALEFCFVSFAVNVCFSCAVIHAFHRKQWKCTHANIN